VARVEDEEGEEEPMKAGRPLKALDHDLLRASWGKVKLEALSAMLGTTTNTVMARAKLLGLPMLMPARGRRLDEAKRQAVAADLRARMPVGEIAAKHGIHYSTVRKMRVVVLGRARVHRRWDKTSLSRACAVGMTLEELAAKLNAPMATVRAALKRLGLQYRRIDRKKVVDRAQLIADYRMGMPWRRMAKKHGYRSAWGVRQRLIREGIPIDRIEERQRTA
jgi:transposase-like protein